MRKHEKQFTQTTEQEARILELEEEIGRMKAKIAQYEETIQLLLSRKFGASSEKVPSGQLSLFEEIAAIPPTVIADVSKDDVVDIPFKKKKRKARESHNCQLPVTVVTHSLPLEGRACSCCGNAMHVMKTEIRKEIKIIPARAEIIQHERDIFSCRSCERENTSTPIVKSPMPEPVIPQSMASPSAIAYVVNQKYTYGMPLYRLEAQFRQLGAELSRQTMSNWVVHSTEELLTPLYLYMYEVLLTLPVLHADETSVQVLKESGRNATTKSFVWLYRSGRVGPAIILYEYAMTRGSEHPRRFLNDFKGTLHVDGWGSYEKLENVILSGCWTHLRRKFIEAQKILKTKDKDSYTFTDEAIEIIARIYKIEGTIAKKKPGKRRKARRKKSLPLVRAFFAWLKTIQPLVMPKSPLGKAIAYGLNQQVKLLQPFQDGRLDIDNNRAERSIKPFVIGRKNWLFSNTPKGAETSAILYSFVETAKENKLNIMAYLEYLYTTLPNIDRSSKEELAKLVPWSSTLPEDCYLT